MRPCHQRPTMFPRLRYLGFFFDSKLTWNHHVDIVCNRARDSRLYNFLGTPSEGSTKLSGD